MDVKQEADTYLKECALLTQYGKELLQGLLKELEATERKLAEAEKVVEAAEVLFNFNNEQHLLDKNNGHYVGRNKNTIALLCALSDYEASKGE